MKDVESFPETNSKPKFKSHVSIPVGDIKKCIVTLFDVITDPFEEMV